MTRCVGCALLCLARLANAQGVLPWGQAVSVPALAANPNVALYYVASYSWVGTHTDYDMVRQAADSFLSANPQVATYVVLGPAPYQTCDDVPLPVVSTGAGKTATVSIIGYGSNVTSITKRAGCGTASATLLVSGTSAGAVQAATFQGFTVSANHLDSAACGFYGISNSVMFDVACGNAAPGADHEMEFGNLQPNNLGQAYALALYNLKAFDNVGAGKGALVMPVWRGGALSDGAVVSGGSKSYTQQYTRAQIIGPGLSTCSTVPTVTVTVSDLQSVNFANIPTTTYGYVTGITVIKPGNCSSTTQLYLLIQDGVPVVNGMSFTNIVMSHVWNLEPTGSATYGEMWSAESQLNSIFGEHPYTNQTIQIAEHGNDNKHIGPFFDGPGAFGAEIAGRSGSFIDAVFSWDGSTYLGSSGYLFDSAAASSAGWTIQNSQCTDSISDFVPVVTSQGVLPPTSTVPIGLKLHDLETCDGSLVIDWPTLVNSN